MIGFADIEASSLNASFGICFTYCIKKLDGPIIKRMISLEDLHAGLYDRNLIVQFIEDSKKFDRLIFHYGVDRKFDLPFLRTRAVKWGLDFPRWRDFYVNDTHTMLKNKFRLHSNRLEAACDVFGIESKGHKLNPDVWLKMMSGNPQRMKEALRYMLVHNVEDVESLEKLWKALEPYSRRGKVSL